MNSNGRTFTIAKDHELQWKVEGSKANFAMVATVDKDLSTDARPWLLLCVRAMLEN